MGVVYFEDSTHVLPLRSFKIMCGCVLIIQCKTPKYPGKVNEVYGDIVKVIAVSPS
jgi:hypothetical protein